MGAAVPESFVFSKDGRYLYGSSYYTGVSNIYRYEVATETLTAVSNADVGFFRPLPLDESQLIVLRYAAKGFVAGADRGKTDEDLSAVTFLGEQVAAKYPEVQGWVAAVPSTIPTNPRFCAKAPIDHAGLSLESLIPVVEGYKNSVGLGASAPSAIRWGTTRSASRRATARITVTCQGAPARRGRCSPHALDSRCRLERCGLL